MRESPPTADAGAAAHRLVRGEVLFQVIAKLCLNFATPQSGPDGACLAQKGPHEAGKTIYPGKVRFRFTKDGGLDQAAQRSLSNDKRLLIIDAICGCAPRTTRRILITSKV